MQNCQWLQFDMKESNLEESFYVTIKSIWFPSVKKNSERKHSLLFDKVGGIQSIWQEKYVFIRTDMRWHLRLKNVKKYTIK